MAVCQPGVDWNKGYLIDLGAAAEELLAKCYKCDAIVTAFDYGYDDTLRHAADCPVGQAEDEDEADKAENEELFRKAQAEWDRLHRSDLP